MPELRELRAKRKKTWDEAWTILSAENVSAEDQQRANKLLGEVDDLKAQVETMERAYTIKGELEAGTRDPIITGGGDDRSNAPQTDQIFRRTQEVAYPMSRMQARANWVGQTSRSMITRQFGGDAEKVKRYEGAFEDWLRAINPVDLPQETRAMLQEGFVSHRDLGVATGAAGGYTVPPQFLQRLVEAQLAYGGMRRISTIINTSDRGGADLPIPTDNDTAQAGAILAEAGAVPTQDIGAFGQVTLHAYMYTSKMVKVSFQLMQDAFFPLEPYLARKLGIRLARIQNTHFTTGTGTAQPNGVVTAATLGKTGLVGQTLTIIYDDLVDLLHSVDPAYRAGAMGDAALGLNSPAGDGVPTPSTWWMFHDKTLAVVRKIKDSQGRPIWAPGLGGFAGPVPDTLLGYPYQINQDVAQMAANAKSVLFGDFSNYFIRDALDVQVIRLNERFADNLEVGFIAFQRSDGNLVNAGTNPVKYYANSAT